MKKETNKKDTYEQVMKERDRYRRTLEYMIRNFACQFTKEQHNKVQKLLKFEKEKNMNAEVIKANKAAFDFGLNGGKIWTKNYENGEMWFLHEFCELTFDSQELVYVPDNDNAEIVKAYLDGKGEIEYSGKGEWKVLQYTKEDLLRKGLPAEYQYRVKPSGKELIGKWCKLWDVEPGNYIIAKVRNFDVGWHRYEYSVTNEWCYEAEEIKNPDLIKLLESI